MTPIIIISSEMIELVRITQLAVDKKYKNFDVLKVYQDDSFYEVVTINKTERFVTKTIIGKIHWRVKSCTCNDNGEEIRLK
ncbi:MAG: hypothetical protein E6Q36_05605 [Chryseobacterium sp.]|nr:MAG: hypothetical protein E6Q36_05605 [Chryseobacterium sp.]